MHPQSVAFLLGKSKGLPAGEEQPPVSPQKTVGPIVSLHHPATDTQGTGRDNGELALLMNRLESKLFRKRCSWVRVLRSPSEFRSLAFLHRSALSVFFAQCAPTLPRVHAEESFTQNEPHVDVGIPPLPSG